MRTAVRQLPLISKVVPEGETASASPVRSGLIEEVRIHRDLDAVEAIWRDLQSDAVMTPYQGFDLLAAWVRNVAEHDHMEPLVTTGHYSCGKAIALLPLGLRRYGMLRAAEFLGGEHANYNLPIFRSESYGRLGAADLTSMLEQLRVQANVDVFDLQRQPESWAGRPNPFLLPASQPSPSFAYSGVLDRPFAELYPLRVSKGTRAKDRKKMRRLEEAGSVRFFKAETPEERRRTLEAFFQQKAARFAAQGIPNVFNEKPTRAFVEDACRVSDSGPPALDLYALEAGGEIIATLGVAMHGGRASAMFNSICAGPLERYSPGIALMHAMIADAIERGCTELDFGVGEASYKSRFCTETDRLLDGIRGVSPVGRLAAVIIRTKLTAKRQIKTVPWLRALMEGARRRQRTSAAPAGDAADED